MATAPNLLLRDEAADARRSPAAARWGALIAGGALAAYGLSRRSLPGLAVAAGGGALIVLGSRFKNVGPQVATGTIVLNCSLEEAYRFWHDFQNLPRFMRHLETVSVLGNGRSRWVAIGPVGTRVEWEAEIIHEREPEYIAWRSVEGSDIVVDGFVEFSKASGNRGTLLRAALHFDSPRSAAGRTLAKLVGKDPKFLMQNDLRRFKALIETGEIPTIDGQSHGPRDVMTAVARMVNPDEPLRRESNLSDVFTAQRRIS